MFCLFVNVSYRFNLDRYVASGFGWRPRLLMFWCISGSVFVMQFVFNELFCLRGNYAVLSYRVMKKHIFRFNKLHELNSLINNYWN